MTPDLNFLLTHTTHCQSIRVLHRFSYLT